MTKKDVVVCNIGYRARVVLEVKRVIYHDGGYNYLG